MVPEDHETRFFLSLIPWIDLYPSYVLCINHLFHTYMRLVHVLAGFNIQILEHRSCIYLAFHVPMRQRRRFRSGRNLDIPGCSSIGNKNIIPLIC